MLDETVAHRLDQYRPGLAHDVETLMSGYLNECCDYDPEIEVLNMVQSLNGLPPIGDPWMETGAMRRLSWEDIDVMAETVAAGVIPLLALPTIGEIPEGAVAFEVAKPRDVDDLDGDGGSETAYTNRQVVHALAAGEWAFLRETDTDSETVTVIGIYDE